MSDIEKVDGLVEKYVRLRDLKDRMKAEYSERESKVVAAMDDIEGHLMTFLNQTGQESGNTKAGTFFKRTTTSAKVADRDVFLHFVLENNATNFLESRVNKTAVEEYIEATGGVPPGVDVTRAVAISVNRPKSR